MPSRYQTYFPGEDRSGEILSNALGQAIDRYVTTKQQRKREAQADADRQRGHAVQDFQLAQQGVTLLPTSFRDITPGSLPNPADRLDVSGASPAAMNDRLATAVTDRALAPTPSAAAGRPIAQAVYDRQAPDPTAPAVAMNGAGLRFGNGWVQDLDVRNEARADAQAAALAQALGKALATRTAERMVNPEAADAATARAGYLRAMAHRLEQPPVSTAHAPVRGTPAYLEALGDELALRQQYRTPAAGRTTLETPRTHALRVAGDQTRQALTETNGQIRALDRRISDAIAPSDTTGIGAERSGLVARADSLRHVADQQAADYQSLGLGGRTTHATSPLGLGEPQSPQLDRATSAQLERELGDAGANLKTVLDSDAPAAVKAQARRLHSEHVRSILHRYGVDGHE